MTTHTPLKSVSQEVLQFQGVILLVFYILLMNIIQPKFLESGFPILGNQGFLRKHINKMRVFRGRGASLSFKKFLC